jgi:hypothetical protein
MNTIVPSFAAQYKSPVHGYAVAHDTAAKLLNELSFCSFAALE